MNEYEFTLIVDGLDLHDDDLMDRLFEAGCDDATFGAVDRVGHADFDREANSLAEAITTAIGDVESAGLEVRRVEPDELVTMSEIAQRTNRTRESIRLHTKGLRGDGTFPLPYCGRERDRLWQWAEVAAYFGDDNAAADGWLIATINSSCDLRNRITHRPPGVDLPTLMGAEPLRVLADDLKNPPAPTTQ